MHNVVTMGIKAPQIWFDEETKKEECYWDEGTRQMYKSRDVELCVMNRRQDKSLKKGESLFSYETWEAASKVLTAEAHEAP